jgi:rRNA-processing protein FCF1
LNKEHIKIISLGEKGKNNVDILIIKYAKAHPDTTIATLDRELKSKIKGNMKIVIHDKRALEISSR